MGPGQADTLYFKTKVHIQEGPGGPRERHGRKKRQIPWESETQRSGNHKIKIVQGKASVGS